MSTKTAKAKKSTVEYAYKATGYDNICGYFDSVDEALRDAFEMNGETDVEVFSLTSVGTYQIELEIKFTKL